MRSRSITGGERSPTKRSRSSSGSFARSEGSRFIKAGLITTADCSSRQLVSRVQPLELRVAVQKRQVGVTPHPDRVAVAELPRLSERIERLRFSSEVAVRAGAVVVQRRIVGAQFHRELHLANRILRAADLRVVARQQRSRTGILRNLRDLLFERLNGPLPDVAKLLFLAQRQQRVRDRNEDAVILSRGLDRGVRDVRKLLIVARTEERTAE